MQKKIVDGRTLVTDKKYRLPKQGEKDVLRLWARRFRDAYLAVELSLEEIACAIEDGDENKADKTGA